jgi:hypothetical protein
VEDKLHDVLRSVTAKQSRSRLEPYCEFVEALRRQGFTCRDIATLLAEKCQLETSKSAVNRFVRARARRRKNANPSEFAFRDDERDHLHTENVAIQPGTG